jgi:hypothetical protein
MKKIHIILVVLFAFAVLTCTSGVASAYLRIQYVGNTMVDLSWSESGTPDFSKYELYRDGSLIETIKDRTTTFYRDEGLTKGYTYNYEIRGTYGHRTTSATTGKVYGTITRDTVWTVASSPYDLAVSSPYDLPLGTVFVRNGANLTIEKGVMVTGTAVEEGYLGVSKKGKGALYAEGVSFYDIGVKMVSVVSGHAEIKNCFFEGERIYLRNSNNNVITGNTVSSCILRATTHSLTTPPRTTQTVSPCGIQTTTSSQATPPRTTQITVSPCILRATTHSLTTPPRTTHTTASSCLSSSRLLRATTTHSLTTPSRTTHTAASTCIFRATTRSWTIL